MNPEFVQALEITWLGLAIVFGSLALLAGLITLITQLTSPRIPKVEKPNETAERLLKRRVAAAAVAFALEQNNALPSEFPLPPTAVVSAWQTVMRTNMLNKRGQVR